MRILKVIWHYYMHQHWLKATCRRCQEETEEKALLASLEKQYKRSVLLPEEEEEVFRCYYEQIYMRGEDEEMFERDRALGALL